MEGWGVYSLLGLKQPVESDAISREIGSESS